MSRFIDRAGQKFGKLTALSLAPKRGRHTMWRCRCECSTRTIVSGDNLKSGHTTSCGCNWHEPKYPREDLVGRRYGMLVVEAFAGRAEGRGEAYWRCKCDCGAKATPAGNSLKTGASKSCGCGIRRGLLKANTTHGKTRTPEYRVWSGMLTRCYNKKEKAYQHYGARGITVCARWQGKNGFVNFIADMGQRPSGEHWIEREKNDVGYRPDNCVWATRAIQVANKRNTIRVQLGGRTTSLKAACRELGLNYYSIRSRMQRKGMTFRQAISAPFRRVSR